jgi:hypothetical protein
VWRADVSKILQCFLRKKKEAGCNRSNDSQGMRSMERFFCSTKGVTESEDCSVSFGCMDRLGFCGASGGNEQVYAATVPLLCKPPKSIEDIISFARAAVRQTGGRAVSQGRRAVQNCLSHAGRKVCLEAGLTI